MWLEAVARHAAEFPEREALVAGHERVSYAVLWRRASALGERLQQAGVGVGDIVPLILESGVDFVVALLAVLTSGASALPLSPQAPLAEHEAMLAPWPVPLVLLEPNRAAPCQPALVAPFHDESERPLAIRPGAELLIPTSGSTGGPKIVRLGMAGVAWNARAHANSVGLTQRDRLLVVMPMPHAAPLVAQVIAALQLGAALVVTRGPFVPRAMVRLLGSERISALSLTPTHVRMILDRDPLRAEPQVDLSGLRLVTVGAAPIQPEAILRLAEYLASRAKVGIYLTYGLTEAGPRVTTLPAERLVEKLHTVGLALEGVRLRVVSPEDPRSLVEPGACGELQVQSPSRMLGYLGEPAHEGWLATGDLASLDAEGFITLHGRIKDIIVSGGQTISPWEIERALYQVGVREAAVVGEPHELLGEIAIAYVVPAAAPDAGAILKALSARLADYKLPRKLRFVEGLPLTTSGKVDKQSLRLDPPCEEAASGPRSAELQAGS